MVLFPMLLLYKFKIIPNYKAKQYLLSWYFKGMKKKDFFHIAKKYSLEHIDLIIRPDAIKKLNWHKKKGHKVVIVSASIDCWLRPWCEQKGFELIATKIEFENHKVTGKLLAKNCYGIEKVIRIKENYNLNEYTEIYAYGDSAGDKEMLALANFSFFKPFRK